MSDFRAIKTFPLLLNDFCAELFPLAIILPAKDASAARQRFGKVWLSICDLSLNMCIGVFPTASELQHFLLVGDGKGQRDSQSKLWLVLQPSNKKFGSKPISNSKSVAAVILGGGAGTRLYPLTKSRAKPAVPIGGAYRLIGVPMSNCLNSGISKCTFYARIQCP